MTATIRPLSREPSGTDAADAPNQPVSDAATLPERSVRARRAPLQPVRPKIGSTLDGSWDKKLRSGAVEPDRIVDLHGHSLDRAWHAIDVALDRAIASGDRVVLLITGHERAGEPPVARGKIRAAVHDWLAASRHAPKIASVRGAHRRHGGGGSLYVILRRN